MSSVTVVSDALPVATGAQSLESSHSQRRTGTAEPATTSTAVGASRQLTFLQVCVCVLFVCVLTPPPRCRVVTAAHMPAEVALDMAPGSVRLQPQPQSPRPPPPPSLNHHTHLKTA